MDETPVFFDMVRNLTIEERGAKTVQIRTTGNEKNRFTCVLTVLADGTKLPPIVICLNKPFKDRLREKWNAWMSSGQFTYTKGGNLKKPDYSIICKWVLEAWAEIPKEMIVKSFKKCGISNAMDGSEDDLFGQDETEENDNDEREILNIDNDSADEYSTDESDELNE